MARIEVHEDMMLWPRTVPVGATIYLVTHFDEKGFEKIGYVWEDETNNFAGPAYNKVFVYSTVEEAKTAQKSYVENEL